MWHNRFTQYVRDSHTLVEAPAIGVAGAFHFWLLAGHRTVLWPPLLSIVLLNQGLNFPEIADQYELDYG